MMTFGKLIFSFLKIFKSTLASKSISFVSSHDVIDFYKDNLKFSIDRCFINTFRNQLSNSEK